MDVALLTLPATVALVNEALRARGEAERLSRGQGYFYFHKGRAHMWPTASVYVFRVEVYTVAQWLALHAELKAAHDARRTA